MINKVCFGETNALEEIVNRFASSEDRHGVDFYDVDTTFRMDNIFNQRKVTHVEFLVDTASHIFEYTFVFVHVFAYDIDFM